MSRVASRRSALTTESDLTPTLFFVKAGGLDQTDWLRPTFEMFVGRRGRVGQRAPRRDSVRRQSSRLSEATMNSFQTIFDAQKTYFASGVTRTYDWRIEQLDRMAGITRRKRGGAMLISPPHLAIGLLVAFTDGWE
jgi:hypothetical protein